MDEKRPKHILVLEDLEDMRAFIAEVLSRQGYRVSTPVDSYVALTMARQQPYDLATVDLVMPLMDGVAFVQALREMRVNTPVVIVTAFLSDPRIGQLKQMGVRHFLSKPFHLEALFKAVREALGET